MVSIYNIEKSSDQSSKDCLENCYNSNPFIDIWWTINDSPKQRSKELTLNVLSRYVNLTELPNSIQKTKLGKPYISPQNISFSITHTSHFYCIAISNYQAIGIDCEEKSRKKLNYDSVIPRLFHPRHYIEFQQLPTHLQHYAFLQGWTKYESFCKYYGRSIFSQTPYLTNLWHCTTTRINSLNSRPVSIHPLLITSITLPAK